MQRINVYFGFQGNGPIPNLHLCFIYRSEYMFFFYESLQIAFPNNVLASFTSKVNSTARHTTEERGGRADLNLKQHGL